MEKASLHLVPNEVPLGLENLPAELPVRPWEDKVVETLGFGPRSMYVEMCWLPVLGPTTTWLYRRLGSWAEFNPDGLSVDMVDLSLSLGLGRGLARSSMMARAVERLTMFHAAEFRGDHLRVRRALAPLPEKLAVRLSDTTYRLHQEYTRRPRPQAPLEPQS